MTALSALEVVHGLTVIDGGKPRRGRPPKPADDEDVRLELAMRADEEREQAEQAAPLLRRAEMFAVEVGPAAYQVIAGLITWHQRHARRWTEPGSDVA